METPSCKEYKHLKMLAMMENILQWDEEHIFYSFFLFIYFVYLARINFRISRIYFFSNLISKPNSKYAGINLFFLSVH